MLHGSPVVTIVAGNLMALPQQNAKRLLAYSGIAHIGYMLVGFAASLPPALTTWIGVCYLCTDGSVQWLTRLGTPRTRFLTQRAGSSR
jgi:NADH:ubiquinone oxidoreductase subunit 2 (subunit N)